MDQAKLISELKRNEIVRPFLVGVIDEARIVRQIEEPKQYSVAGIDVLLTIAAYALFRWAKDHFDQKKEEARTRVVAEQAALIAELAKRGFPTTEAREIVTSLMKELNVRKDDDAVLLAVQKITQGNN